MTQQSDLILDHALQPDRLVRYAELPVQARKLLWLTRMFIAAQLDYAAVARPFAALAPGCSRAVPVLLCHLLLEVSRRSARRLLVAGPCHAAITEDEMRFVAAIDLAQRHDPRLPDLLARLYGLAEEGDALAPVLLATHKLSEALLQEGLRVEACALLSAEDLPAIH